MQSYAYISWIRRVVVLVLAACCPGLTANFVHAQLSSNCTATVNGQAVAVDADGAFRISNVPANGELVRVNVTCEQDGLTLYGQTEFFQVVEGGSYSIGDVSLSETPPAGLLRISVEPTTLQVGSTTTIPIIGDFTDGSMSDVAGAAQGSTYTLSSSVFASVDEAGAVTALTPGVALMTVRNQGATTVAPIIVTGQESTTVVGSLTFDDGAAVAGATVSVLATGQTGVTQDDGSFLIEDVPTDLGQIVVGATVQVGDMSFSGTSEPTSALPGAFTDVGVVILEEGETSAGTDFALAFTRNFSGSSFLRVYISAQTAASGTVTAPGQGFTATFSVVPGQVAEIILPASVELAFSGSVESKGVRVQSDNPICVYGLNQRDATTDGFLALPVNVLGNTNRVYSYAGNIAGNTGSFAVVSAQDGNTITVTSTISAGGLTAGVPQVVALDANQAYYIEGGDFTGTLIESTAPVAVLSGHRCANVPASVTACDHLVEQIPRVSSWGTRVLTVPLATRIGGDTFRIMAAQANTEVEIIGPMTSETVTIPQGGGFVERILDGQHEIVANAPILVAQYSNGTSFDGVLSDPFIMLVPPSEQYRSSYTFATPPSGISLNFINVITPAGSNVLLDGLPVDMSLFEPIGTSGFVGAQVPITIGSHSMQSTQPMGVFVYGFDSADSYGYPAGMALGAL